MVFRCDVKAHPGTVAYSYRVGDSSGVMGTNIKTVDALQYSVCHFAINCTDNPEALTRLA